jgi:hypothetical protein
MKFFAAILASAAATEYTVCSFTQTFYATTDTTCASTVSATDAVLAIKGVCTYSTGASSWYKITNCDTGSITVQYQGTYAACTDPLPLDGQTITLDKDGSCAAVDPTGIAVTFYTKIATLAGSTTSTLCGLTWANHTGTSDCTGAADTTTATTVADMGLGSGVWIVNQCYYMGVANRYFKITACTSATAFTVLFYTEATCTTAGNPTGQASTTATECVANYFQNGAMSL